MKIDLRPQQPEFEVIDETDDWIIVDKPAHLLVYPSKPDDQITLLKGLEQLLVFEIANGGQISIMNRLDRETSGIVLVAKRADAASKLGKAIANREFQKSYLAIVHGKPAQDIFLIDEPIIRKGEVADSEIYIRQTVHPTGKPSKTQFELVETSGDFSILKCRLFTGRTHQIRVHLEFANLPLVGDKIYGHDGEAYLRFIQEGWTQDLAEKHLLNRHALHASALRWGDQSWESPLPQKLVEFLKKKGGFQSALI